MNKSLQIGNCAPNFYTLAVYQNKIGKIRLSDYIGKKYVILIFYPLNFISLSSKNLLELNFFVKKFRELSTQILAVSVDSPFSHLQFLTMIQLQKNLRYLQYPLISDLNKEIARKYDTLTGEGFGSSGIFIIDKDGLIQYHTTYNILCNINMNEVFKILQSITSLED